MTLYQLSEVFMDMTVHTQTLLLNHWPYNPSYRLVISGPLCEHHTEEYNNHRFMTQIET